MNANEVELQLGARQCCRGAGHSRCRPWGNTNNNRVGKGQKISLTHTHTHTDREMPPRSFRCARSTGVYIISIWRPFGRQRVASRRNGHLKDMPTVPAALAGVPPLLPPLCLLGARDEKRNNIKICVYVLLYFLSFSFLLFALAIVVVAVAKEEWSGWLSGG